MTRSFIISIEGNIGSGKSTLVNLLKKHSKQDVIFCHEPVDVWSTIRDGDSKSILNHFYEDKQKYAFAFQMMAYVSRLSILNQTLRAHPNCIIVSERSIETDCHVFAKMLHDQGVMNDIEHQIYLKWFDEFSTGLQIQGIIHMDTSPTRCFERILTRNREGEIIQMQYLNDCHMYHEDWLKRCNNVLKIDGNLNLDDDVVNKWVQTIDNFIETCIQTDVHR